MACLPLPEPPALPALPPGISLTPTLPPLPGGSAELCCKLLDLPPVPPLPPLPVGALTPALAAVIESIQTGIAAYKDALPFNCAKE